MCLSKNDLDGLHRLVSPDALVEVKSSLSRFSVQQMTDLAVDKDDIYFCFPHEVGVMYDDEDGLYIYSIHLYFSLLFCFCFKKRPKPLNQLGSPRS